MFAQHQHDRFIVAAGRIAVGITLGFGTLLVCVGCGNACVGSAVVEDVALHISFGQVQLAVVFGYIVLTVSSHGCVHFDALHIRGKMLNDLIRLGACFFRRERCVFCPAVGLKCRLPAVDEAGDGRPVLKFHLDIAGKGTQLGCVNSSFFVHLFLTVKMQLIRNFGNFVLGQAFQRV